MNPITDIRAVNFWDWAVVSDGTKVSKEWVIVRNEIQIKRGDGEWMPMNVFDRDNEVINIDPPDFDYHNREWK